MVVDDSYILMQIAMEEGTLTTSTLTSNKARSYTCLVCRNRGPWWHDPLAQCFSIGGAKYVSFHACEQVPIGVEQQRSSKEKEHSSCLMCARAAGTKLRKAESG
jgi:hypothetical protein